MPKIVRYTVTAIFCFVFLAVAVYAIERSSLATAPIWHSDMYTAEILNTRQQGLDIRGEVPILTEEFGPSYEALNEEIMIIKDALIEGTRRIRARSVRFDYEIEYTNDLVSIVIYATARAVTDRTTVMALNFHPRTGQELSLIQAMNGRDITPLAEGKIAEMIRQDPATYFAAFTAPPTGQAFYMTDTHLVLLFDEFQLSSVPGATSQITFELSNITDFNLLQSQYRISTGRYAIRMIPLRIVLNGLGYEAKWDAQANEAIVSLNGETIIVLSPDVNNYQLQGVLQRSLESAPVIYNNNMYVPISFFDQILNLTAFHINTSDGSIAFISYLGRPAQVHTAAANTIQR